MSGAGRIASLPVGRTKWLVLVFWVAVFAVAGPLAGKLNSAQQNDASAWLPNNAESTQVVEQAKRFTPSDVWPALVVYEHADGPITPPTRPTSVSSTATPGRTASRPAPAMSP